MALILVGMDEAGFGPLLGPMCVASSTWRVEGWERGGKAPDLWSLLKAGVCRKPEARGRIAVADSKKLKLANERTKPGAETARARAARHPLMHLERGVLAMVDALGWDASSDEALLASLGARAGCHPCYGGEAIALPLCASSDARGIAANFLRVAMSRGGAVVSDVRCETVDETAFNAIIERTGNKAEVSVETFGRLVSRAVGRFAGAAEEGDCLRIVCDRLGGRASYGDVLARWFPACEDGDIVVVHESESLSRYVVHCRSGENGGQEIGVSFEVE